MLLRYESVIAPALDNNRVVVCDRYFYTSFARDTVRGVDETILEKIYQDLREPDAVFHCICPLATALKRLNKEKGLSYYGSGMDLGLDSNPEDNYRKYGRRLDIVYRARLPKLKGYHRLDTSRTIKEIAKEVREVLSDKHGLARY